MFNTNLKINGLSDLKKLTTNIMKKVFLLLSVGFLSISCYDFNREQQQKDAESNGKSILLEAESSKKAMIEEARAKNESAVLASEARLKSAQNDAKAKIMKADAEAEYIMKVGKAIQNSPDYVKYLQVKSINDSKAEKIFIPTESNMPILINK